LDFTRQALQLGQASFKQSAQQARYIEGSMFSLPLKSNCYDIVFNSGTLEHFSPELQRQALVEMARVAKPNGWVITFNGYARSIFYRLGKFLLEKSGGWTYGEEFPIYSLVRMSSRQMRLMVERHLGFNGLVIEGFKLLGMEPLTRLLRTIYFRIPTPLTYASDRILSSLFGGYLLMSAFRKTVRIQS
jgi:ubiquinone/menaquinone biosynthesis C-methylase UbiE